MEHAPHARVQRTLENMKFSGGLAIPPVLGRPPLFFPDDAQRNSMNDQHHASLNIGLILSLAMIYVGLVIWMYVTAPWLLLVFGGALVVICAREYAGQVLRAIAHARLRNRSIL
jgi:hypothetical protein